MAHFMKPEDLLQQLTPIPTQKCTLGCPILDRLLNGGIPCNSITELVSESGCGKTQISLQLLLSAQLPASLGGLNASSLYLYSESPFPLRRLHQLSYSFPTLNNPLDRIFTQPLHSAAHLFDVLSQLDTLLLSRQSSSSSPIKIIVIDSIAALFRFEFENNARDLKQRSGLFFKISSKLKEQARRFGLAIVVINQVVDVMDDSDGLRIGNSTCLYTSERKVAAALGLSWANCVNTRLFLSRNEERIAQEVIGDDCFATQTRRFICVVFAPHLPDSYSKRILNLASLFCIQRANAITILVFASLAIASLFVAFSYYCYTGNKVDKHLKNRTDFEYYRDPWKGKAQVRSLSLFRHLEFCDGSYFLLSWLILVTGCKVSRVSSWTEVQPGVSFITCLISCPETILYLYVCISYSNLYHI